MENQLNYLQNQVNQLSSELTQFKQETKHALAPHSIESSLKYNSTEISSIIMNQQRIIAMLDYLTQDKIKQINKTIDYCYPEDSL